ncbi:MAG: REP-associated tyrosine transposase [Verrucomicrobiales bacterium]
MSFSPKGHHERGYLPHRDYGGALQAVTFRTADSVPAKVVQKWKRELLTEAPPDDPVARDELRRRIARYEDAGYGACLLADPANASFLQTLLLAGHGKSYRLLAWCIMPNHVHLIVRQGESQSLGEILRHWKGRSARVINQRAERVGRLWSPDYFDRVIRKEEHFYRCLRYVHQNPVKAGLVNEAHEWAFSSAGQAWGERG